VPHTKATHSRTAASKPTGSQITPPKTTQADAPDPRIRDMPRSSWIEILKRSVKQFKHNDLPDRAAALTYFGVLAIFPGMLVLVSILGMLGKSTTNSLLDNLGGIAPGVRSPLEQVLRQFLAPERQQRPHEIPGAPGHAGQSGRPGSAQHAHEHRLHLIVGVMPGDDAKRTEARALATQPGVARCTRVGLGRGGAQLEPADGRGQAKGVRESRDARRHRGAVGMDAVVGVRHHEGEAALGGVVRHQKQEGYRIGPAGDRHEPGARRKAQLVELPGEACGERGGHGDVRTPSRRPTRRRG